MADGRKTKYCNITSNGRSFPPFIIRAAESVRVAIDELFVSL